MSSSTQRLQMYITMRTKVLPDDAEMFVAGGRYENQCLFCRNPASKHPVISSGVDTRTHMCNWCKDEVDKEMAVSHYDDAKLIRKRSQLLDSINPGLGFPAPPDIQRYFIHLNGGQKDYFAGMQEHCFICERKPSFPPPYTDEEEEFETIEIPIRAHKFIMGGRVHICGDKFCTEAMLEYRQKINQLGYNTLSKEHDALQLKCPSCNSYYTLVGSEIPYHNLRQDTHEWQCPQCAYDMLNLWEKSEEWQKFYPGIVGEPRTELFTRHVEKICSTCLEYTAIDYLQTEFSFCLNNVFRHELICTNCARLKLFLESNTVYKFNNSRIYIETHPSDNTFSIFRLKRGELKQLTINGNTGADNEIDNLLIAFEETAKLIGPDIDIL